MKKRRISLGFKEPSKLEKDTIYLTASYGEPHIGCQEDAPYGPYVNIISNKEFIYHVNQDEYCEKKVKWMSPYKSGKSVEDRVQDLVENNNGQLDYSRLIDEGCKAYAQIDEAMKKFKDW